MSLASAIGAVSTGQAMPLAVPDMKIEARTDIQKVQSFCFGDGCRYERRHHRRHYDRYDRYERPRHYRPRYERPRYYGGGGRNAHVRWCLNRYRTYDPGTNRYHAGGGVYRACYSPYR